MKRHKKWLGLLMVPLMAGCGAGKADSGAMGVSASVTGVEWRVESVTAGGDTLGAPAGGSPRLTIGTDGSASGDLGCNRFSARVSVHGDRITFGALRTTKMACDPARTRFERALTRVLDRQTVTGTVEHGKLTLTSGHGDLVRLGRGAPE
ncbi:META domain-containing protein [Streptomyces sp. SCL15-4]|jgi:heat shock protein HslJ|uniref:META domain-containing protein n=1 Tax=Streptomyces sp. SCL15-4 TaxID=2967221 RepID=UPI00296714E0|nr:META domain-containing protein [Streptomyces sp. SCL15-4]